LQATGGDDYELCFAAKPTRRDAVAAIAKALDVAMTRIGRVAVGNEVVALDANGKRWNPPRLGFDHFGG
jgi:thiamine-monophosphate kinase